VTETAFIRVPMLGAKMLSPCIGTPHFLWTAQTAVALVTLAAASLALTIVLREWVASRFLRLPSTQPTTW